MRRKELIKGSKERMTHRLVWLGPAIGTGESLNKKRKKEPHTLPKGHGLIFYL
jgi:hypothetical protein